MANAAPSSSTSLRVAVQPLRARFQGALEMSQAADGNPRGETVRAATAVFCNSNGNRAGWFDGRVRLEEQLDG